ncbi:MAG TPA: carboxypeptidase regulatory-like domain-containing protein [Terracidiphilus sp.]|nr:carboxypeptidase regulatory-like domain-containing protein [Terracidiphilus sp.]
MSEALQFGQHPDADQISAFVEQALPAHEREQMLDHLAICQECRTIVALSLPEVEEPAQAQRVVARKPWWLGWTLAWPVAAAIIAGAFFIVHRYPAAGTNSVGKQVTVARSEAAPVLREQPIAPAAAPAPQRHNAPVPGSQGMGAGLPAPPTAEREAPLPAPSVGGPILTGRNRAALRQPAAAPTGPPAGNALGALGGAQLAAAPNGDLGIVAGIRREGAAATQPEAAARQPVEGAAAKAPAATESVAVSNAAPPMETVHSDTGSTKVDQDELQAAQPKRPLPSRLQVLSMARQANRIVAIDTGHAVFASNDGGKHWQAIQAPWMGRAVQASLVQFPADSARFLSLHKSGVAGFSQQNNAALAQSTNDTLAAQAPPPPTARGSGIGGTVTDMSGAVVPGATVTVTNSATGAARTVTTDSAGRYVADGLAAGTYRVEARSGGFNKEELAAVAVSATGQTVANLSLTIGAATETVTVQAGSAELSASETAPAKSKASPPAPVFEIVTDNGEHWTSADGVTWKRM